MGRHGHDAQRDQGTFETSIVIGNSYFSTLWLCSRKIRSDIFYS